MTSATSAMLLAFALQSCIVAPESSPRVRFDLDAATQYNNRGTPEVNTGVVQGEMNVTLPTKDGGKLSIGAWANMDMQDDTGNAWFPDGAGGDISEFQVRARYNRTFGRTEATLGLTNYSLTRGSEFVNGPAQSVRGNTNEVSLVLKQRELLFGVTPRVEVHYDYDLVDGYYVKGGLEERYLFGDKLALDLDAGLAYSDKKQSSWTYGIAEAGLADLSGQARLSYLVNASTTISVFVAGSTLIDQTLRDWFQTLTDSGFKINADNLWAGVGMEWKF